MKSIDVVLALIPRGGRWFLQRRDPASAVLPGRWEFPGGKVAAGESLEAALRRELREEVGWEPAISVALPAHRHAYADRDVVLHPFRCEGPGWPRTDLAWGWFTTEDLSRLPLPEANGPLLALLREPG